MLTLQDAQCSDLSRVEIAALQRLSISQLQALDIPVSHAILKGLLHNKYTYCKLACHCQSCRSKPKAVVPVWRLAKQSECLVVCLPPSSWSKKCFPANFLQHLPEEEDHNRGTRYV